MCANIGLAATGPAAMRLHLMALWVLSGTTRVSTRKVKPGR